MHHVFYLGQHEFVALCDLLKLTAVVESGGQAKHLIESGQVQRNGVVETRKTAKIRTGEIISTENITVRICSGNPA